MAMPVCSVIQLEEIGELAGCTHTTSGLIVVM